MIQKYLERAGMHWILANVVQAVLFGVFHQNLVQGIYAALLGVALGFVAHRYNTLAASMLMHMFYNLMGTLIVDLESRFLPAIVMAVSYTHLDVYKRQDILCQTGDRGDPRARSCDQIKHGSIFVPKL